MGEVGSWWWWKRPHDAEAASHANGNGANFVAPTELDATARASSGGESACIQRSTKANDRRSWARDQLALAAVARARWIIQRLRT